MEYEINERITLVRKTLKLSQTAFGEAVGVSRDVVNNIDNLRVPAKPLLIQQICKTYNVDPYWLETGEGPMFLERDEYDELLEFAMEINTDRDLEWVKELVLSVKRLSPEQRAEVSAFVHGLAGMIAEKTKKEEE